MVEATEMLKFLGTLKDLKNSSITIICDRGYMSEDNVQRMDDASLNFLLMLKSNMNVTKDLLKNTRPPSVPLHITFLNRTSMA